MQRLSLGSPHSDGLLQLNKDDDHHKSTTLPPPRRFSVSSSSTSSPSSPPKPEKLVHFIPLLTLLCFFLLYLVSHTPSQSDLAQFKGFKQSAKYIHDSVAINDVIDRFDDIRRGDVLALSNLRNLQEIAGENRSSPKTRLHRKIIADV
ncbi:uncharacterized protein LOC126679913 [Mercurialis annua]|uniref:uncharacterized protein LOC126679913 n=1 Tax=Mercurialis annua TaxID=3986 RepID=UPI00215EEFF4|nr:uncharacterized protein LOC126679913 [Mercurialis annua]